MRQRIVAGNWKMNLTVKEGLKLAEDLQKLLSSNTIYYSDTTFILAPSFLHLLSLKEISDRSVFVLAAQNISDKEKGAFTGEVSAAMLASAEIKYAIIGHSERRLLFHESNEMLKSKINLAIANQISPIFCCGEPLDVRENNTEMDFVLRQLDESLFHLEEAQIKNVIIAYEPIWAIGTGQTATPEQAEEMHRFIRTKVEQKYSPETAEAISILYGGSVNPKTANSLFSQQNIDGALVGGASLVAEDFFKIMMDII